MASLGAVTVTILRGTPIPTKQRVEAWQVPGINGYGLMTLGLGDAAFDLIAVFYCLSNGAAETVKASVAALQGTVITVIDNFGVGFGNVGVIEVGVPVKEPMIYAGYASAVRMQVAIKCVRTQ